MQQRHHRREILDNDVTVVVVIRVRDGKEAAIVCDVRIAVYMDGLVQDLTVGSCLRTQAGQSISKRYRW